MKNLFFVGILALVIGLTGCSKDKKNSGSTVAVTPAPATTTCSGYTQRNGFYYDANNQVVSCNQNGTNACVNYRWDPTRNQYVDTANNVVSCVNNQVYNQNGFLPYNTIGNNGCAAYTHGVFYPVLMGGTIVCVGYSNLTATFNQSYLNNIYYGGVWSPGNPILASCQTGTANCKCGDALWGTLNWCWATF